MKIKFFKTLKFKTVIIMAFVSALSFFLVYLLSTITLKKQFQEIEDKTISQNVERVIDTYNFDLKNIDIKLLDWAIWDDTYGFIIDKNKVYIESNLIEAAASNLNLSYMIFVNNNSEIVYSVGGKVPEELVTVIKNRPDLTDHPSATSSKTGVVNLESGLIMFACRPIVNSLQDKPIRGSLIFVRVLDEEKVKELSEVVHLPIKIIKIDDKLSEEYINKREELIQKGGNIIYYKDDKGKTATGLSLVKDIFGNPAFILEVEYPRDITHQGSDSINYFLSLIVLSSIISLIFLVLVVNRLLVNRIQSLSENAIKIKEGDGDVSVLVDPVADEITVLQKNINEMLVSLKLSKSQLHQKSQFIEAVLDNITIGIVVNEISTGKTVYINKALEDIYDRKKEKLTSVDEFFNCVYPDQGARSEIKQRIMSDIRSGDPKKVVWNDIEITKENGEKRFVNIRNIILSSQNLMVSTVIDVTDQKHKKDEEKKHTDELENLNKLMFGRELKMIELKKEIEELKRK